MTHDDLSRRNFLRTTTAAAAGALVASAGLASAQTAPASKPAAKPRPRPKALVTTQTRYSQIRVACIGVGGRGRSNLEEIVKAGGNVVALCDIDSDRLDAAGKDLPNARKHADFRD